MKKLLTLIVILISISITTIPVHAGSYEDEWLARQKAFSEQYMNELEKDGNLTAEAEESITKKKSKKKSTKDTEESQNNTNTNSESGKGIVYDNDELHVVGLPEDEDGYTKGGDYR